MERFHTEEKDKIAESEDMGYQHKDKNTKQIKIERSSSSEAYGVSHRQNFQYTSDSSEDNHHTRKRKFKPYEEIFEEFKKIKPPTPLMEKLKKGKKQNPGYPGRRNTSKFITTLMN